MGYRRHNIAGNGRSEEHFLHWVYTHIDQHAILSGEKDIPQKVEGRHNILKRNVKQTATTHSGSGQDAHLREHFRA